MEEIQEPRGNSNSRIIVGAILVLVGLAFLLDNLELINFNIPHIIFSWPMFLIIIGLIIFVKSRNTLAGTIFVIAGLFFLLPRIFPWIDYDSGLIFPLLLILGGIFILARRNSAFHRRRKNFSQENLNFDTIDDFAIFGGGERIITSEKFQGGTITSIFGGSEIDLTNSKLAPGKNVIDVLCVFGGTTLIVPRDWNVVVDVFSLFGGFSNKARRDQTEINKENSLIIKGFVLFGGGEIKRY